MKTVPDPDVNWTPPNRLTTLLYELRTLADKVWRAEQEHIPHGAGKPTTDAFLLADKFFGLDQALRSGGDELPLDWSLPLTRRKKA